MHRRLLAWLGGFRLDRLPRLSGAGILRIEAWRAGADFWRLGQFADWGYSPDEVSPPWIQFANRIDRHTDQEYLHLDIMTLDANEKHRKL
jgi:hypothetical protein